MFLKDLEDTVQKLQSQPKSPKGIKVTTEFWHNLRSSSRSELPEEYIVKCPSLPVVIDDEIDGLYEFVY